MSVQAIREFVASNPGATIMEIREGLGQYVETDDLFVFTHPETGKGHAFMIGNVSKAFYENIQEFMRADDVIAKHNPFAAMVSDKFSYPSRPGLHYFPVSLKIGS